MKEARMPLSLWDENAIDLFLNDGHKTAVLQKLSNTCQKSSLKAQAVAKILGNEASPNNAYAIEKVDYPELGFFMPSEL